MKVAIAMMAVAGWGLAAFAQEARTASSSTNAAPQTASQAAQEMEVSAEQQVMNLPLRFDLDEVIPVPSLVTTSVITGPLVEPFRAPKASQVPKRLLNLINPFAPMDKTLVARKTRMSGRFSAQSWPTAVGWTPVPSRFADERDHEPALGLFVVNCP